MKLNQRLKSKNQNKRKQKKKKRKWYVFTILPFLHFSFLSPQQDPQSHQLIVVMGYDDVKPSYDPGKFHKTVV